MGSSRAAITAVGLLGLCVSGSSAYLRQHNPAENPRSERLARPQEPAPPCPYEEEEVRYENPSARGVALAGTLTKPRSNKPVPAVLLITGAGPQDRNETISGHKPFLVLADYLTRRGIAVLRVDDRGTGQSTGDFDTATTQDFASDAEAGVRFLMTRSEIDQAHIGLIGHGEGAIVAAMTGAQMPKVAFMVLLAGTAVPGEAVPLEQTARAQTAAGLPEDEVQADFQLGRLFYTMVREGKSEAEMHEVLARVPQEYAPFLDPWKQRIPKLESPWLRFFLSYDPRSALEKVECPVLALWGAKDMQVDPEQNAPAMKSALSHAHNHDVKIKILPGLNYLFQKANTGLAWEYTTIPETISPNVLEMIGDWINAQIS